VKLNDSLRSENNGKMTKIFKKIGFFLGWIKLNMRA
jgi:hypothetical protein